MPSRRPVTSERAASQVMPWLQRAIAISAFAAIAFATANAAFQLHQLQIERIAVSGSLVHVTPQDIERQAADELSQGFLRADLDHIRRRLERMPWVHRAQVRRHWPDTIGIHVIEQQPIARWSGDGYLNHEGEFFPAEQSDAYRDLPLLNGPIESSRLMMQRYLRLEQVVAPLDLDIAQLNTDALGQVTATFRRGTQLILGHHDFAQRLKRFVRLWHAELDDKPISRIDMRYSHGAAVSVQMVQVGMLGSGSEGID